MFRKKIVLTGSSRTDAGVHAYQNFFHFDIDFEINNNLLYNINSLLPQDIVVKAITPVADNAHSRFDASSREYHYFLTAKKNPFLTDTAWFYPYTIEKDILDAAAAMLFEYNNFTSFSKRNSDVATHECTILKSEWKQKEHCLVYEVKANRFLRGMVRGLVGTMLLVGRRKITLSEFGNIILAQDCTKASFATPPHGLVLTKVDYNTIEA